MNPVRPLARAIATVLAAGSAGAAEAASSAWSPAWGWGLGGIAIGALGVAAVAARALRARSEELQRKNEALARTLADSARAHAALGASEERFRVAASNVSNLIYDWDFATGRVEWFGPIDQALGHPPGGFPRTEAAWNAAIVDEDRERILEADRRHLASRTPFHEEYRVRRADGTVLTWSDHGTVVGDEAGRPRRFIGAITDVSERRAADEALRASERRFRALFESAMVGFIFWDLDGRIRDANDEFLRMTGWTRDDLLAGRVRWLEMTPPEWREQELRKLIELQTRGVVEPFEKEYFRRDGSRVSILIGSAFADASRTSGFSWVVDQTERKRAEAALRGSEEHNRRLVDLSPTAILILVEDAIGFANPAAAKLLGAAAPGELTGKRLLEFVHPNYRDPMRDRLRRIGEGGEAPPLEEKLVRLDGGVVDAEVRVSGFTWRNGPAAYVVAVDISARKRADESLRASEERFRQLAETIDQVFWIVSADHDRTVYVSPAFERVYGRSVQSAYDDPGSWYEAVHPEDRALIARSIAAPIDQRLRIVRPDGVLRWVRVRAFPVRDANGRVYRVVGLTEDITGLVSAEEARVRLQGERDQLLDRLQLQLDAMPIACLLTDDELTVTYANPASERILGVPVDELIGRPLREAIPAGDAEAEVDQALRGLAAGKPPPERVLEGPNRHGKPVACEWHHMPLDRPGEGFVGAMSMAIDIGDRRRLEDQLRHAQKMEAIGQLAGGVAHDFNNLLTLITGYGEMHLQNLAKGDPRRRGVEQMLKAAKRAGALTQQLLAFSRRQVLQPKVLDLNTVITDLEPMLRRVIGEDIDLVARLSPNLGRVRADPGQIEQVIMNLCVNARDAMPKGGRLLIETANVELDEIYTRLHPTVKPGSTVMLAVADSGVGMDQDTQARIFEPFFTTKEAGKGTGLGLATVYGIVKQSGGNIWFTSEPGRGTVFKLYLPRVQDAVEGAGAIPEEEPERVGTETILLVEDEIDVRDLIREMLTAEGYRVVEAGNGADAIAVAEKAGNRIDLMMTDVVMPKMSGPELAEKLGQRIPNLRVLYMSGYMDKVIVNKGVLDQEFLFLEKPFTSAILLRKVREALDQGANRDGDEDR